MRSAIAIATLVCFLGAPALAGRQSSREAELEARIAKLEAVVAALAPKRTAADILADFRRSASWVPGDSCDSSLGVRIPTRGERAMVAWSGLHASANAPVTAAASTAMPSILAARITSGPPAPGSGGLPSGCTDNQVARADGTAGATQCGAVIIEDDGDLIMASGDVIRPNVNNPTALHYATDDDSDSGFASNVAFPALRVAGTNVIIATSTGLNIVDSNVGLSETGTNDLALTADGVTAATFTSTTQTFTGDITISGDQILIGDSAVQVLESGTNDLRFLADSATVMTLNGGAVILESTARLVHTAQAVSQSGADTLTPTSAYVEITCSNAGGCAQTFSETGAVEGQMLHIVNLAASAGAVTVADSAGVVIVSGASISLGDDDHVTFIYDGTQWQQHTAVLAVE